MKASAVSKSVRHRPDPYCYQFECEWYRTTELPARTAIEAAPDLLFPSKTAEFFQGMSVKTGEAIMKALWNSPLVALYESFSGLTSPPADDALLTDFRAPPPDEIAWPTMPSPGFIFGCNSQTMDECLGRGVLGLPAHMSVSLDTSLIQMRCSSSPRSLSNPISI